MTDVNGDDLLATDPEGAAEAVPAPTAPATPSRMSLEELKARSPADLLSLAESLSVENANALRKQDMMFAILKATAEQGAEI